MHFSSSALSMIKSGIYRHYKGNQYRVLLVARHSETEEPHVVYQTLYGAHDYWIRPLAKFTESVEVDGRWEPRFKWLSD